LYLADVLTVITLNSRLRLDDIPRFYREWWLLPGLLHVRSILTMAVAIGCFFVTLRLPVTVSRLGAITSLCLLAVPLLGTQHVGPAYLRKYVGSVFLVATSWSGGERPSVSVYDTGDFETYRPEYHALFDAPIAGTHNDIILVIVESLSAADSYRTSGIRNLLPRFDELSREGTLFRNFLANSEASEGGLVALLSGVPPLHFPTASTNTFEEYARLPSITGVFARAGYRCEFITSVPLDFLSMDAYAKSPFVGFSRVAGQEEIARFNGAENFGFESPADHLLYEEILDRLSLRDAGYRQPVLLVAVTASSHWPYVDPLGRNGTEENVWAYVQEELWWLYSELSSREFFDNGLLLITGDHRKMMPVSQRERERYGESAKARIPLVVIGKGVPRDVVDDRLFQQADLFRMLNLAAQPQRRLSPFVLWTERYVLAYGLASNASRLEVFEPDSQARRAYSLSLRGTEIDWITPPAEAFNVERSIHRQRASQQEMRTARVRQSALSFGRELTPSAHVPGMLIGLSKDMDLGRDPDDPAGELQMFTAPAIDLSKIRTNAGVSNGPFTLSVRGYLDLPHGGEYWFSVFADRASCLAIDKQVVLGCKSGLNEGLALLTAGVHRFDLRFTQQGEKGILEIKWLPPGTREFVEFPQQRVFLPRLEGSDIP
jgi:hypothetical protein